MCLYPKLIENKKYMANKKNKGIIAEIKDQRVLLVPVGCGKCMECMKQKARAWKTRLNEEIRHDKTGHFVTFTLSEESYNELAIGINTDGYELENQIAKKAIRRFLERWRKKYKKSIKHFFITELGHTGTERIHLHGIVWTEKTANEIRDIWKYGFIWDSKEQNGYVNERTINYIAKYMTKTDKKHGYYKQIVLTSAGIGKNYIERPDSKKNKFNEKKTNETYTNRQGYKSNLSIYFRNKIYNEEQREKLWIMTFLSSVVHSLPCAIKLV